MSETITKLKEEYDKKVKEIQDLMKNPNRDPGLFSNNVDFRDKNLTFANSGGSITSKVDKLENYPVKGYPYKRGVKLSYEASDNTEPCVEAGGGTDLYGICIDIDDFTGIATVLPITNNFTGYLVVKQSSQSSINPGNKIKINTDGEVENNSSSGGVNGIALSKAFQVNTNLYIALVSICGNRGS
ncbi:DUF228 domain-containing protein [Borrelia puertoricensis]|uniref:DUF228 domain-containing protein n=1 Tax=Borrelia puertoricensis TaxID=2756107 RepID=UPI001FF38194|nr:DUF228 domain-containing protein [Borrelia puertoricensis]UPA18523.1 DUF228 domain-containing protein [Borrelia puertoricensis]